MPCSITPVHLPLTLFLILDLQQECTFPMSAKKGSQSTAQMWRMAYSSLERESRNRPSLCDAAPLPPYRNCFNSQGNMMQHRSYIGHASCGVFLLKLYPMRTTHWRVDSCHVYFKIHSSNYIVGCLLYCIAICYIVTYHAFTTRLKFHFTQGQPTIGIASLREGKGLFIIQHIVGVTSVPLSFLPFRPNIICHRRAKGNRKAGAGAGE